MEMVYHQSGIIKALMRYCHEDFAQIS